MISTKKLQNLPNKEKLQKICKSISVLDAIISQDWEYRYYSYNQKWRKDEELYPQIFFTRPVRTLPGPSSMNSSYPSRRMRRISSVKRTGEIMWFSR